MKKISLEKYFVSLSYDSLIYGVGNAVIRLLGLITAPIFTRIFLPAEYGIISLIASIGSFMSLVLIFGIDQALFVSYYEYKKERKIVISSAFWFLLTWGLFLVIISSILGGPFSNLFFKTPTYRFIFLLAFWSSFFNLLVNLSKAVFRLEFRAKVFTLVTAINAIVSTGLMVLFVVYYRMGLTGYFTGLLIGTLISSIIAVFLIRNNLSFKISKPRLKEMLSFGVFILPTSISFFVFDLSDRFFLNHYWNLSELGLYSIGINIASILTFFSFALGQAWSPMVMKIYFNSKKIFHEFVPRFFTYYLIFFFSLAVLISLFGQEVLRIFATEKFLGAYKVIGPLSVAMVCSASVQVTAIGITITRKTKFLALYTAMAAVVNIVFNFLLIPKYGMVGAGYATTVSYLFLTIAYYLKSQKLVRLNIDIGKVLKLAGLSLITILLSPMLWKYGFLINILIKLSEFGGLIILFYLFGVIEKKEIQYILIMTKKFMKMTRDRFRPTVQPE